MMCLHLKLADLEPTREELLAAATWLVEVGVLVAHQGTTLSATSLLAVAKRPPVVMPFAGVSERFVLSAMALYFNPLVQVAELRQFAERLWPRSEWSGLLYETVGTLLREGKLVSHARRLDPDQVSRSDPEQLYVSLPVEAQVLASLTKG
jgi:hypothetical protein